MSSTPPSKLTVAAVVTFYMVAALVMVFVNKAVLNSSPNLPMLMLWIQFILAVICLHVSALFTPKIELPKAMLTMSQLKQLAPILIVNVVGLTFNTLCLRGVDASFFQIARGLVLPLTIIISAAAVKKVPSIYVTAAAAIVTVGFFVGVAPSKTALPSSSASSLSLMYGGISSLMTAVHAVLIKKSLPYLDNSTIKLAYWTNASAVILLAPFVVLNGEVANIWSSLGYSSLWDFGLDVKTAARPGFIPWDWKTFVWGCSVTGVVGFLLCIAGLLSIKITSPVTHMFSSAMRSVLQTLLGIWIFSDILTTNRIASIGTIVGGTMYYTWIKAKEADSLSSKEAANKLHDEAEEGLLMTERSATSSEHILFDADEEKESR